MHVDTSSFKVLLQSPNTVINAAAIQSQDRSGKVLTPEGPHLCVGYVIETVHCLRLPATYGGSVTAMVVVYLIRVSKVDLQVWPCRFQLVASSSLELA